MGRFWLPVSLLLVGLVYYSSACLGGSEESHSRTDENDLKKKSQPEQRKYTYISTMKSLQETSKVIQFKSEFYLVCRKTKSIDKDDCVMIFDYIRTRMKSLAPVETFSRRRRPAPGDDGVVEEWASKPEATGNQKKVESETEDIWFDMNNDPIAFTLYHNGTVSDVLEKAAVNGSDSKTVNDRISMKRSLAYSFQTSMDLSIVELLERDELGEHFTDYSYKKNETKLRIYKTVEPSDFVTSDTARPQSRLRIFSQSWQTVDLETKRVWDAEGLLQMKTHQHKDSRMNIPMSRHNFAVSLSFNLTSKPYSGELIEFEYGSVSWKPMPDIKGVEKDPSAGVKMLLQRKLEKLEKLGGGSTLLLNFLHTNTKVDLKVLRQVVHLEQQVVFKGLASTQPIFESLLPIMLNYTKMCAYKWPKCFPVMEILLLGGGNENVVTSYLQDRKLSVALQTKLINLLATTPLPSPNMLRLMVSFHKAEWFGKTRQNLLLALGAIAAKESIPMSEAEPVANILIELIKQHDCEDTFRTRLALEATGNLFTSRVAAGLPHSAAEVTSLVDSLLSCSLSPQLRLAALSAVRNMPQLLAVQEVYENVMIGGNCDETSQVVTSLTDKMFLEPDSWPAVGKIPLDVFILRAAHQKCILEVVKKYADAKLWPRGFKPVVGPTRHTRQDLEVQPPVFDQDCVNWASTGENFLEEFYIPTVQSAGEFDSDAAKYTKEKLHCLIGMGISADIANARVVAGFFTGVSPRNEQKLYGKISAAADLIGAEVPIASMMFIRESTLDANGDWAFAGNTTVILNSAVLLEQIQYECNVSINDLSWGAQYTTPAFRISLLGTVFVLNADFEIRVNLTVQPSYCSPDGVMGARFRPVAYFQMDAYAELENEYFGIGVLATMYLDYYISADMGLPSVCFYVFHGNNNCFFKIDVYLKLPSFVFVDFNPVPVIMMQSYPVLTWQFLVKKAAKYILFGICAPGVFIQPDPITWEIG